jgi:ABC-2 type transport system ATP-binding protein
VTDNIIKVDNVSKQFKLPHERASSVKSLFTNPFNKNRRSIELQHALKNISFEIKEGEFFGIVGRNGSGKSTLLKMLAGIYQPTSGTISVSGKLVPFIELGVGFNPELTGRENVYLNGALLGFSEKEVDGFYDQVVDFAELERFMDQKLKNYSSGMQVRLAFSMAVQADADILLIDEVLAVGDADFQRKCFEYFKKLKKDKKTVVFVSHDMSAVREYCDRCIFINDSRLEATGTALEIADKYLKLFNTAPDQEDLTIQAKNDNRWGDGSITYDYKPKVEINKVNIEITVAATAHQNFDNPVFGILIKDQAGQPIFGTNSKINNNLKISMQKGESKLLKWYIPNILSSGTFSIDMAISHDNEISQCDWWHDAGVIRIRKEKTTPYAITPTIDLQIS